MLQSSKYYKTYGHTLTRNSNKPDPNFFKKKNRINELNKYKQTNKKSNNDIFTLTWNPNKVKVIKKKVRNKKLRVKKIDPYPNTVPLQLSSEQGR